MSKKERVPRQSMPEQDPMIRAKNFDEVPLGYTEEQAVLEAKRCIQCKKPLCIAGCPVDVDIPGFIKLIAEEDFIGAALKLKETNALPAICGRVCPQDCGGRYSPTIKKRGDPHSRSGSFAGRGRDKGRV